MGRRLPVVVFSEESHRFPLTPVARAWTSPSGSRACSAACVSPNFPSIERPGRLCLHLPSSQIVADRPARWYNPIPLPPDTTREHGRHDTDRFPHRQCGSPHVGTTLADLPGPRGVRRPAPRVPLDLPAKPRRLVGRPLFMRELAEFAAAAFEWVAVGQGLIVLALVRRRLPERWPKSGRA